MPLQIDDPATGEPLGTARSLLAIYQDLAALNSTQRANVWADFTAGVPAKWSLIDGPTAPEVAVISCVAIDLAAVIPAAARDAARLKMVAIYLYSHPLYLAAPAFDPSIDVRPDTP